MVRSSLSLCDFACVTRLLPVGVPGCSPTPAASSTRTACNAARAAAGRFRLRPIRRPACSTSNAGSSRYTSPTCMNAGSCRATSASRATRGKRDLELRRGLAGLVHPAVEVEVLSSRPSSHSRNARSSCESQGSVFQRRLYSGCSISRMLGSLSIRSMRRSTSRG